MANDVATLLNSVEADLFFDCKDSFLSDTTEAILRYIAIKHPFGEAGTIQRVSTFSDTVFGNLLEDQLNAFLNINKKNLQVFVGGDVDAYQNSEVLQNGWIHATGSPLPISEFLSASSKTNVYINSEQKVTAVFVRELNKEWIGLFCSVLPKLLPWIYTPETIMSDEEVELFRLVSKKRFDSKRFREIMDSVANEIGLRNAVTNKYLSGWSENWIKDKIEELKKIISCSYDFIRSLETEIASKYDEIGQALTTLNSLQDKVGEETDEVCKFFSNHRQLTINSVNRLTEGGSTLRFSITDTVEFYDVDQFNRAFANPKSFCYRRGNEIAQVLHGIFAENKGTIRVHSVFSLRNLTSLTCVRYGDTGKFTNTHLPHPHHYHFACLGGNDTYIRQYMNEGSWDMAIEQAIASVKNINLGDCVVMEKFVQDIANRRSSCKCIIADNGTEMTPNEFLAYLKTLKGEQ